MVNKTQQEQIFTYLLTSARGLKEEPPVYGPMRLLDAFALLCNNIEAEPFFQELAKDIASYNHLSMSDEDLYWQKIDETIGKLTDYMINKK